MPRVPITLAAAAVCLWSGAAWADDKLNFGATPDWVEKIEPPAERSAATQGAGVAVRLFDVQGHYEGGEASFFTRTAVQVDAAEALAGAGNVGLTWQPGTDKVTVHHLLIRRGGETIDVLKSGREFTILRREEGLEQGRVDGQLTASLQVPDLRVGDTIDLALTTSGANPLLKGRHEHGQFLMAPFKADRVHLRFDWPQDSPTQWKVGEALPKAAVTTAKGRKTLLVDQANFSAPILPDDAPGRFADLAGIQISSFKSWSEIAAIFSEPYAAAATAGPAIKDEAKRIAAAHADAKGRATAALELVQKQVRYLFDGTGLGNYKPAAADEVWERRYGDCKGKTVLLLALLHELGIEAAPALVSTGRSDGLDQALPVPGRFDHVIVKATIDGRTYWLDGTRNGDRKLDEIKTPPFRWALPLLATAARLEPLPQQDPDKPQFETVIEFDAREGLLVPAKATLTAIFRDDGAVGLNAAYGLISPADRNRALTSYWTEKFEELKVENTEFRFDPDSGEARLIAKGTIELDWGMNDGDRITRIEASYSRLGRNLASTRQPGPYENLPVQVTPTFERNREIILLPNGGKDFFVDGEAIDRAQGPARYHRTARVANGRFEMEAETRISLAEMPVEKARTEDRETDSLYAKRLYVRAPASYMPTEKEQAQIGSKLKENSLEAATMAIFVDQQAGKYKEALAKTDTAIAAHGKSVQLLLLRAQFNAYLGDIPQAMADVETAIALNPDDPYAIRAQIGMLRMNGRNEDALIVADRLVLRQPGDPGALQMRAEVRESTGRQDQALADYALVIELQPDNVQARLGRVRILSARGDRVKALAETDEGLKRFPENVYLHALRGNLLAIMGQTADAKLALRRSIEIEPSGDAYITRLSYGLSDSPEQMMEDILKVIDLEPGRPLPQRALKAALALPDGRQRIVAAVEAKAKELPNRSGLDRVLADLDGAAGNHKVVLARMAETIAKEPKSAQFLNERCWYRATNNIELDQALTDCDAAIAIQRGPAYLDSRGLVHFRKGEYEKAVQDYDSALIGAPGMPSALFGRGLAKLKLGQTEAGKADLAAATKASASVADTYAEIGLKP